MPDENKIVALGPMEEIVGLASVGVETHAVERSDELAEALERHAADPAVRLLLLSETVASGARELVAHLQRPGGPAVLIVPSHRGSAGTATEWIKHGMDQMIGVDMMSKD